jgi:predicted NBD/HSP70 family sugar kinase
LTYITGPANDTGMRSDLTLPWQSGLAKTARRLAGVLLSEGPSTQAQLGGLTGLSRQTISTALTELRDHGLVETGTESSTADRPPVGRRAALIRLSRRAGLVVGVDIGRRHVQVVLADLGYQEIDKAPAGTDAYRHPPSADTHPDEVLDKAAGLVQSLLARNNSRLDNVVAIGLGIPAPVTRDGLVGSPTLLPGWSDINPAQAFSKRLGGLTVFVDNDANLGALGEYTFGGAKDALPPHRSYELVYVKVATGIGAGIVRDGQLHRGASGVAGELGHVTLDYKDPAMCRCGSHGCLEMYAGADVLLKRARVAWPDLSDTLELVDKAKAGDPACISVIKGAGDHIGIALGILVDLTGPDMILIGGELSDSGEILLGPIREKVSRTAMAAAADSVTISNATLRKWSSAWGAAALALKASAANINPRIRRYNRPP